MTGRRWTAAGLAWLPVAVTAATLPLWRSELPEEIATHWDGNGPADQFSSTLGFWALLLVIGAVAGAVAVGAARSGNVGARFWLAGSGAVTGGTAGIWVATVTATLANPADPRMGAHFLYFLLGVAWGVVTWAVAGRPERPDGEVTHRVHPLELAPTERAAYSTTLRAPWLTAVLLASAAVIVVVATTVESGVWPVAVVPIGAAIIFGRVRVTADRRGLRLVAGLIGVTLKHIPLAAIVTAHADEINPIEWGGWGYRVTPGRSALVLRAGPALVLVLTDGRRFAVTVDQPEVPAALLTALQSRA